MRTGPALLLREVRRRLLLHRRLLAALSVAGAVMLGIQAARPAPVRTVAVWTAAHDLAGGRVVQAGDLRRVGYPARAAPAHTTSGDQLVGRVLVAPLRAGAPLSDLSVVGRAVAARYADRTVVPVRLSDAAAAALLRPGDRVDLVAGDPSGDGTGHVVADDALVVTVPAVSSTAVDPGGPAGRLVLLAVTPDDATAVSLAGLGGFLGATWVH